MSFLVSDCSHCGTKKIRFDNYGFNRPWPYIWDVLAICSECHNPTVFRLIRIMDLDADLAHRVSEYKTLKDIENLNLLDFFQISSVVIPPTKNIAPCPLHVPENIKKVFNEAATCLALNCYIASGAMFRLCLDITTKELLIEWIEKNSEAEQPDSSQKSKLFNRIEFLIKTNVIPSDLKDYAHHIRLDGNDAAHDGSTQKQEAEDLLDFSELFLERIYTMKKQLELAQARRLARRNK